MHIPISRLFKNEDFGYRTIMVERPERDAANKIVKATKGKLKGKPQPDANLRDTENVPLSEDVETYFKREVLPHAPDAWIDHEKTKTGYEIPFNRHFYVFKPPRELAEIDAELKGRSTWRICATASHKSPWNLCERFAPIGRALSRIETRTAGEAQL